MGCSAVILLDTHIWVWWVHGDAHLPMSYNKRENHPMTFTLDISPELEM